MKLKKTGNRTIKTYDVELHLTDLESITAKGELERMGIEDELFVLREVTNLKTVVESSGKILSETTAQDSERTFIVSKEQVDDYIANGTPLKNYKSHNTKYGDGNNGFSIVKKSLVDEIIKANTFSLHDKYMDFVPQLFTTTLKENLESKEPLQLVMAVGSINHTYALLVAKDTFIHQAIKIEAVHFHSDSYNFDEIIPAMTKFDTLKFLKETKRGKYELVDANTKDEKELQGVVEETPHYNQNEKGDLMEATVYFYPTPSLAKIFIENPNADQFIKTKIEKNSDGEYVKTDKPSPEGTYNLGHYILNVVLDLYPHSKSYRPEQTIDEPTPKSPVDRFKRQ